MAAGQAPSAVLAGSAELIEQLGGSIAEIAAAAGVPEHALRDRDVMVDGEKIAAFFERAAEHCETRDFGLRLARLQGLQVLGPVWAAVRSAPSIRAAMFALAGSFDFHTSAAMLRIQEEQETVAICYDTQAIAGRNVQTVELGLAILCLEFCAQLAPWRPIAVQFRHAGPADVRPHRAVFGDMVLFDQDRNALVLDYDAWARPMRSGAEKTHKILLKALQAAPAHARSSATLKVELTVRALLPTGRFDLPAVARDLGMPPRTLQQRLATEGTGFQAVLDGVRLDLARKYLTGSNLSVAQIAELLSFSDSTAFSRFVRLKTGASPRQIRDGLGG